MADPENARPVISLQEAKDSGLKRYFTGVPCIRGHLAGRWVSTRACSMCLVQHKKDYYYRDPASQAAKVRAYYLANRESVRAKANAYDKANPDKRKARFKTWYDRNREAFLAKKAADRKANPEKFKARYKQWSKANPEHVLANVRLRQVRKKGAPGHHTGSEIKDMFKRQRGKCAYCRKDIKHGYHADHIVPISKGGSNWISNIQLTCADCNYRKWAKDPFVWAKQIGQLL